MAHRKTVKIKRESKSEKVHPYGEVSIDELEKQFGDTHKIDLKDKNLREFDRIARKYRVLYSVHKNEQGGYHVFFKSSNAANLEAAFSEYTAKKVRGKDRPSVLEKLSRFKELIKSPVKSKTRKKEREL